MIRVEIEHRWTGEGETLKDAIRDADPCGDLTPCDVDVYRVRFRAWNGSDQEETFEDLESAESWLADPWICGCTYAGESNAGDARYYTEDGEIEDDDDGAYLPCICPEKDRAPAPEGVLWPALVDLGLADMDEYREYIAGILEDLIKIPEEVEDAFIDFQNEGDPAVLAMVLAALDDEDEEKAREFLAPWID